MPSTPPPSASPRWRAPFAVETARLSLRALGPEHARALHDVLPENKAHLAAAIPWIHDEPLAFEERLERMERMRASFLTGAEFSFGIFERAGDALAGGIGLHPRIGPDALEIGYWIAKRAQGRGYVSEAVTALCAVAVEFMGARRLEIRCSPANARSRAVPERLGFHLDGILREGGRGATGELEDKMVWSLLASEYPRHPLYAADRPRLFDVLGRPIART